MADISRVDIDKLGGGEKFSIIQNDMNKETNNNRKKRNNKKTPTNNTIDSLIGEFSAFNDLTLITGDKELIRAMRNNNFNVIESDVFISNLKNNNLQSC